jgi:hypothetical protein
MSKKNAKGKQLILTSFFQPSDKPSSSDPKKANSKDTYNEVVKKLLDKANSLFDTKEKKEADLDTGMPSNLRSNKTYSL